MKGHDLGKAMSIIHSIIEGENMDDKFGRCMGAPMGELSHLINRGKARKYRLQRRRIKAITGLKYSEFCKEVEKRTSRNWAHANGVWHLGSIGPEAMIPEWNRRNY